MPTETGIWSKEEASDGHLFSYKLAKFIGDLFEKKETPVIDMGCGPGEYVKYLYDRGFTKLLGVEGTELDEHKDFKPPLFLIQDLTMPFSVPSRFGNVICLEVGEHIPAEHTEQLIKNLVRHVLPGHYLVMSWAVPGQEGLGHVNCMTNEAVVDMMLKAGMIHCPPITKDARAVVENHVAYFRETILVFLKGL